MTKQLSTESIGAATTGLTIFNHSVFPNDSKEVNLDKVSPRIRINGDTMKPINNLIPDP